MELLKLYKKIYHIKSVVFSDSAIVTNYVKQMGFSVMPIMKRNKYGIPVLKWILIAARDLYPSKQIMYINSDILINPFIFELAYYLHNLYNETNVESFGMNNV